MKINYVLFKPLSCIAVSLSIGVVGAAYASFDGKTVVKWEETKGTTISTIDTVLATASDSGNPDLANFHSSIPNGSELWDIDFSGNDIALTYTSITKVMNTCDNQLYAIHFENTQNNLPEITQSSQLK